MPSRDLHCMVVKKTRPIPGTDKQSKKRKERRVVRYRYTEMDAYIEKHAPRTRHLDEEETVRGKLCANVSRGRDLPRSEDLAQTSSENIGGDNQEKYPWHEGKGDFDAVGVRHGQGAGINAPEQAANG